MFESNTAAEEGSQMLEILCFIRTMYLVLHSQTAFLVQGLSLAVEVPALK